MRNARRGPLRGQEDRNMTIEFKKDGDALYIKPVGRLMYLQIYH